ncbi:MAG: hypothetical protein JSV08_01195 [Acidobacteriota bacterium]|nr:MAG: hypothetical protein JSV08_01195 [Acidobacteriota bacterium]
MKRVLCAIVIICGAAGSAQGADSLAEAAAKEQARRAELRKQGVESTVVDNKALEKYKTTELVEINFSPRSAAGKARRPSRGPAGTPPPVDIERYKADEEARRQSEERAEYLEERLGSGNPLTAIGTSISEGERESYGSTYSERRATARESSSDSRRQSGSR